MNTLQHSVNIITDTWKLFRILLFLSTFNGLVMRTPEREIKKLLSTMTPQFVGLEMTENLTRCIRRIPHNRIEINCGALIGHEAKDTHNVKSARLVTKMVT